MVEAIMEVAIEEVARVVLAMEVEGMEEVEDTMVATGDTAVVMEAIEEMVIMVETRVETKGEVSYTSTVTFHYYYNFYYNYV